MFNKKQLKTVSAITVFAFASLIGAQAYAHPDHEDKERGPVVEKTFDFTGFDEIDVSGVYDMNVQVGKSFSIHTSGEKKEMDRVEVSVKDGTLILALKKDKSRKRWNIDSDHGIDITITMPALTALEITGVGNGEIHGIDSDVFELEISGIGAMELNGRCGTLEADFNGMGDLNAKNLKCKDVEIDVSGMGSASVYASDRVDADMSGMGSIEVYGSPKKVKKDKSFMSSIEIH